MRTLQGESDVTIVLLLAKLESVATYVREWAASDMREEEVMVGNIWYPAVTIRRARAWFLPESEGFALKVARSGFAPIRIPNSRVIGFETCGVRKTNPRFCKQCGEMSRRQHGGYWECNMEELHTPTERQREWQILEARQRELEDQREDRERRLAEGASEGD